MHLHLIIGVGVMLGSVCLADETTLRQQLNSATADQRLEDASSTDPSTNYTVLLGWISRYIEEQGTHWHMPEYEIQNIATALEASWRLCGGPEKKADEIVADYVFDPSLPPESGDAQK
jgi:hypothetical protein